MILGRAAQSVMAEISDFVFKNTERVQFACSFSVVLEGYLHAICCCVLENYGKKCSRVVCFFFSKNRNLENFYYLCRR